MTREQQMAAALAMVEVSDEDDGHVTRPRPPQRPAQVYSVRIPVEALEKLRGIASRSGVAPSSLMREWVLERLESEGQTNVISIGRDGGTPNRPPVEGIRHVRSV